jgi:hypothetical protein
LLAARVFECAVGAIQGRGAVALRGSGWQPLPVRWLKNIAANEQILLLNKGILIN